MSTILKTNFKGTTPGKTLIDLLQIGSHTDRIEIKKVNGAAHIVAEDTKIDLESRPAEAFTFAMPAVPRGAITMPDAFFSAIDDCLQSVSDHAVVADQLGITIIPSSKKLDLYSTDGPTMTYSTVEATTDLKQRILLPTSFCQQMMRLQKQAKKHKLALREDHAIFVADEFTLFSKYIESPQPIDFASTVERHLTNKKMTKLDKDQRPRLKIALDMAARICNIQGNVMRTTIKVQNNVMELTSASERGRVFDKIKIKHPNIEVQVQANYLANVYDRYENILIGSASVVMTNDNSNFLVAVFQR